MRISDWSSDVCSSDLETRGRSRLDQHDEAQTPGRKGANFVRLHRPADEAARFWRDGKLSGFDPGDAGRAIPAPFAQWVAAFEKIARDGLGMGIAPRVSRRCVVADKANDLLAARPGVLGRFPLLEKGVLRGDLPFERALGLDGPVSFASQSPHFQRSSSPFPFGTPD